MITKWFVILMVMWQRNDLLYWWSCDKEMIISSWWSCDNGMVVGSFTWGRSLILISYSYDHRSKFMSLHIKQSLLMASASAFALLIIIVEDPSSGHKFNDILVKPLKRPHMSLHVAVYSYICTSGSCNLPQVHTRHLGNTYTTCLNVFIIWFSKLL